MSSLTIAHTCEIVKNDITQNCLLQLIHLEVTMNNGLKTVINVIAFILMI